MDGSIRNSKLQTNNTGSSIPVHRNLFRSWFTKSHDYSERNNRYKRNRYYKCLYAIIGFSFFLPQYANAEAVGGVSATAAPVANSSGSVTNQAIQVLQGPYITNTYGGGIQCQGETLNITPYVTGAGSFPRPWEPYYDDPVYDMSDNFGAYDDDGKPIGDGILDNPGEIQFYRRVRTGQKDTYNLSIGFSATWSRPLDKKLQALCKEAASTQIALQQQLTANKRLDFELARLKNCGQLMQDGIMFHPKSPYYKVCADVVVMNKNKIAPHIHSIPTSSKPVSKQESHGSDRAEQLGAPLQTRSSLVSPESKQSSLSPSSSQASPLSREDQQKVLQAVQKSSQRQQFQQ